MTVKERSSFEIHKSSPVVCLCGSTKFPAAFEAANERETCAGKIVLSVGFFAGSLPLVERISRLTPELKRKLDRLHLEKIDLADEVLILNVAGYVGESTRREAWYALHRGKTLRWLEPVCDQFGRQLPGHEVIALVDSWFESWPAWHEAAERAAAVVPA